MAMRTVFVAAGLLLAAGSDAAQMDISAFNTLRRGMHESEVLFRAGEPDRVTSPGGYHVGYGAGATRSVHSGARREFHYIPDAGEHDPWLTVVELTHGRVTALRRSKLMGRPAGAPLTAGLAGTPPRRDEDIRRERAERTLRAAERYSEVRWRLQERARRGAQGAGEPARIHSGTDEQGTPYYGDAAPSARRDGGPG